jgi:hypothetical protein
MNKKIFLILFILCLTMYGCSGSNILNVSRSVSSKYARQDGNFLIVKGSAIFSGKMKVDPDGKTKLMLKRAACLDAHRNTLRALGIAEKIRTGSVEYEKVEGVIKGAEKAGETWLSPGHVEITIKVPLNGQISLSEALNYKKIRIK